MVTAKDLYIETPRGNERLKLKIEKPKNPREIDVNPYTVLYDWAEKCESYPINYEGIIF